jgi:hypothetical protein
MRKKPLSKTAKDIQGRFFEAINALINIGIIRGLQTFCEQYDLLREKYAQVKSGKNEDDPRLAKHIDIEALAYLVRDYGVSAEWLLLGRGGTFRPGTILENKDTNFVKMLRNVDKEDNCLANPLYLESYNPRYGKEHEPIPIYDRMSFQEACELLNKSKNHVYNNLVVKRKIPYGRFAHKIVFSRYELQHWMKTQKDHKAVLIN